MYWISLLLIALVGAIIVALMMGKPKLYQDNADVSVYNGKYAFCALTDCDRDTKLCDCTVQQGFFLGPNEVPNVGADETVSLYWPANKKPHIFCEGDYIDCYGAICDANGKCKCTVKSGKFATNSTTCTPGNNQLPNGMDVTSNLSDFVVYISS